MTTSNVERSPSRQRRDDGAPTMPIAALLRRGRTLDEAACLVKVFLYQNTSFSPRLVYDEVSE
jgi:hypothetical protein